MEDENKDALEKTETENLSDNESDGGQETESKGETGSKINQVKDIANAAKDPKAAALALLEAKKKLIKKKIIAWLAPIVTPIIINILMVFAVLGAAFALISLFMSALDTIYEGTDKLYNLFTYGSFDSSETMFVKNLKEQYHEYNAFNNREGEFDLQLILSTVNYGRAIGFEEDAEEKDIEQGPGGLPIEVPAENLKSYYTVMNKELGKVFASDITERKLVGHLIDFKIVGKCIKKPTSTNWNLREIGGEALTSFEDAVTAFSYMFKEDFLDPDTGILDRVTDFTSIGVFKLAYDILSYNDQGLSYFDAYSSHFMAGMENHNPITRLIRIAENSSMPNCADDEFPLPTIVYYQNYDLYKEYLIEHFIPRMYINPKKYSGFVKPKGEDLSKAMAIADDIFEMRDAYNTIADTKYGVKTVNYVPGMDSFPIENKRGLNAVNSAFSPTNTGYITSYYGGRNHPAIPGNPWKFHQGVDIDLTQGDPLFSIADGVIEKADRIGSTTYGYYVMIKHDLPDGTYYSLYAHMSDIPSGIQPGSPIGGGQEIGKGGGDEGTAGAGRSTGSHLHFEIRDSNNQHTDPLPFLKGIVEGKSIFDSGQKYVSMKDIEAPYCDETFTVKNNGSLPTAFAIISRHLGKDTKVEDVANDICTNFETARESFISSAVTKTNYSVDVTPIPSANNDSFKQALEGGSYVLVYLEGGYFNQNSGGHYLAITKYDTNRFLVLDPGNPGKNTYYTAEDFTNYTGEYIKRAWSLKGVE